MRGILVWLIAGIVVLASGAHAGRDGYPYDRSRSGCVQGDCTNGVGVYVYSNDDIYEGNWKGGERHGWGTYYIVDQEPWSDTHKIVCNWVNGQQHGKGSYTFPNGSTQVHHWYHGEEVSSRVEKCRNAQTLSDGYKAFVSIVNGLAAMARGDDVLESAARGYDAADEQIVPRAVDLTCDALLAEFD